MRCDRVRAALAATRDDADRQEAALRSHLVGCAACRSARERYLRQDDLLRSLPALQPRPGLVDAVWARTRTPSAPPIGRSRWARAAAMSLVLMLVLTFGAVSAGDSALPGQTLYPLKRTREQVRLSLTPDPAARRAYAQALRARRLEEVRAVLALGLDADVAFEAPLAEVADAQWVVGGLPVAVDARVWPGEIPPPGTVVQVMARVQNGRVEAQTLHVEPARPAAFESDPAASPPGGSDAPTHQAPPAGAHGEAPALGPAIPPPVGGPDGHGPDRPEGVPGGRDEWPGQPEQAPGDGAGGGPLPVPHPSQRWSVEEDEEGARGVAAPPARTEAEDWEDVGYAKESPLAPSPCDARPSATGDASERQRRAPSPAGPQPRTPTGGPATGQDQQTPEAHDRADRGPSDAAATREAAEPLRRPTSAPSRGRP